MRAILLAALGLGCATVQPTPDAAPIDSFSFGIFDCRQNVVKIERDSARADSRACLLSSNVDACLVHQAERYNPASVACATRDLGAEANADWLATQNPASEVVANAAREWISARALGYK